MIKEAIGKVVALQHLSEEEMIAVMQEVMSGSASPAQIGAFITALRMKGETVDEIVGAVRVMRDKAVRVETGIDTASGEVLMDIVGTGGDGSGSFNVSTTTSFVVAAAGVPVAKHGNRAVSSHCGSADVIEALGVNLNMPLDEVGDCVRQIGIGFLFAPLLHGAMRHALVPRRDIGIRTLFNILGPMTNPAGANVQLTGVFSPNLTEPIAEVLMRLGMKRAVIVWGEGNYDEMTVTGATRVTDTGTGELNTFSITPEELGLRTATAADIRGGATALDSAEQVRSVLRGEPGAKLDMVLLNAGASLMAAGRVANIQAGIDRAREVIASGAALDKVEQLVRASRRS
ncbi:MAG: anthranilate phosphoribosyltransferase [Desulfobulbus sp.]|jgi:anthranilate phosphoribosyltransferase